MDNKKRVKYCIEFEPIVYHKLQVESLESGWDNLAQYLRMIIATREFRK